jgi:site-specific DNA-methyltransferase (adenine-specific)
MLNRFYNMDCMDGMAMFPDKFFELAIVDPPYGLGDRLTDGGHKKNPMEKYRKSYEQKRWDVAPNKEYFAELFRVSVNQIIWGGNYFELPPTRGILCWDKMQMMPTFSRWEYGWTSFDKPAKIFEYRSQTTEEVRFHPTQKPIALYKWLLHNYAKPGDKILDTHVGSASSLIACHQMGFDFVGFELDPDYYRAATERLERARAQVSILDLGV